ncbi:hypothetical protein PSEUBRA_005894 [Kalmanozyma brasiliensis GHG001]|uniref:uncharacterized protein n=1 Tax=Kalmanozyma brasiliensis (strain GHG001) TaxID=1365824 RepID=UPI00286830C9|nr:uncharacterized protein PSEUBRA_005894 [Kalmanozyma brasiliensis GHG001]KAF6767571.1 hypothetical protein PSEUBRA_005894 [Kalmanozyma brasiliensis GHG001]
MLLHAMRSSTALLLVLTGIIQALPLPLSPELDLAEDVRRVKIDSTSAAPLGDWIASAHPLEPPTLSPVPAPDLASDPRPFVIEAMLPPREPAPATPVREIQGRFPPGAPSHPLHRETRTSGRPATTWLKSIAKKEPGGESSKADGTDRTR